MTGAGSRRKGAAFERALVHRLREVFPDAPIRRGLQSRGGHEVPDVDVPGFWFELKHHRQVNLRAALAQAISDATPGRVPVAICKDNHAEPVVVLRLADFLALLARPTTPTPPTTTEPA